MFVNRRSFVLGSLAAPLIGCSSSPTTSVSPTNTSRNAIVAPDPQNNPAAFDAWVDSFKSRANAKGVTVTTLDTAFRRVAYLSGVVERDQNQFQTRRTLEDYIAIATSDERIAGGRGALRQYGSLLAALEARYGVPAQIIAAIWGVESRYGQRRGEYQVISALATLGFASRRAGFFESQLIGALKILQRGETTPSQMTGSWAGAMGHTQFIPTTLLAYAVDFDGDGRRNVWGDDPTDALASAAAYLNRSGWTQGVPWGFEVKLPPSVTAVKSSKGASRRDMASWSAAGLRRADGSSLPASGSASLIRPNGATGPAFLIQSNFNTLLRYNNADKYVIAVGHLSDRLRGGPGFATAFPPDQFGITLSERKRIQERLARMGYDIGTQDGVLGPKTTAAIRSYQTKKGLAVTGQPSKALLAQLG